MGKKDRSNNNRSVVTTFGLGIATSVLVMLAGTFIISWLLLNENIGIEKLGVSVLIVTELSVIIGSTYTAIKIGKAILPMAVGTGIGFFLILVGITALFFGGQYYAVAVTLLAVLGGSVAVALVILKYLDQPKKYRKKH